MGLTIHYSFAKEKTPEYLLREAENIAKNLGWKVLHRSWNHIILHPHERCESIELHFRKVKNIKPAYEDGKMTQDWSIEGVNLKDCKGNMDENDWFCGGFVKTHYAGYQIHIQVVEFLRFMASKCFLSYINDESDYYENGYSKKEEERLKEYLDGYNVMIGNLASTLKKGFGDKNIITGGDL